MRRIVGRMTRRGVVVSVMAVLGLATTSTNTVGQSDYDVERCTRMVHGPWCVRARRRERCIRRGARCCETYPDVKSRAWARCMRRR